MSTVPPFGRRDQVRLARSLLWMGQRAAIVSMLLGVTVFMVWAIVAVRRSPDDTFPQ